MQKNGEGEIECRVAKFIAGDDYIINNREKFFISPHSALSDFSGKVIYYDIEAHPLEGIVYGSGRKAAILRPGTSNPESESAIRSDAPDEIPDGEYFLIEWNGTTRGYIELPEVIIDGKSPPFDPGPCYFSGGNPGGTGGLWVGGGNGSSNVAPKAKKIFRNSNMSDAN